MHRYRFFQAILASGILSLVAANREIYDLLRDGIPVEFDNAKGQKQQERVRLIHFNEPDKNRYLAVTQLWVRGERGFGPARHCDCAVARQPVRPIFEWLAERLADDQ